MGRRGAIPGTLAARRGGHSGDAARGTSRVSKNLDPLPLDPPDWLDPVAAALWREYAPHIVRIMSAPDADTFAAWCVASAQLRALAQSGSIDSEVWSRYCTRAEKLANVLGLTPAARARLPEREDDAPKAGILGLIGGGRA